MPLLQENRDAEGTITGFTLTLQYNSIGSSDAQAKLQLRYPYFILGDLLGLFLSTLVNPQLEYTTASRANCCLPLLTLYNRWIIALAMLSPVSAEALKPAMTQVTWLEEAGSCKVIAFGQSVCGINGLSLGHSLQMSVREARFALLWDKHEQRLSREIAELARGLEYNNTKAQDRAFVDGLGEMKWKDPKNKTRFFYNTSPNAIFNFCSFADLVYRLTGKNMGTVNAFLKEGPEGRDRILAAGLSFLKGHALDPDQETTCKKNRGTKLGNCAETYPLLSLLSPLSRIDENGRRLANIHGIAMDPKAAFPDDLKAGPKLYNAKDFTVQSVIFDPCYNCKFLIRDLFGFRDALPNFTFGDKLGDFPERSSTK
ncbi:hypothetical protein BJ508DRAFT_333707 [Ascobolus immersus RN42]|uniref:Uncharacterized protein n=1 Tax=Ascobolus immersus RN42 TaxID=1160509 RepID=A0A3N4HKM1_ASCIM|nr:hypothetical protein BJ508DRAFT_333707 [Ascobolus immersus RN42]